MLLIEWFAIVNWGCFNLLGIHVCTLNLLLHETFHECGYMGIIIWIMHIWHFPLTKCHPFGYVVELPLEPSLARTLIEANELGCLSQALTVTSMLSAEVAIRPTHRWTLLMLWFIQDIQFHTGLTCTGQYLPVQAWIGMQTIQFWMAHIPYRAYRPVLFLSFLILKCHSPFSCVVCHPQPVLSTCLLLFHCSHCFLHCYFV